MTTLTDGVRLPAQPFHVQRSDLSLFHLSITLLWLLPPTPSATTVFLHRSKLVLELGLRSHGSLATRQLRKLRQYVRDKADLARMRAGSRGVIDELIVELLVNTGLRASELCNLNIGDLPARHGKDCIWVRDGKGKVSRTVDISDKLKKRLERFVKLYRKGARAKSALLVSERGDLVGYWRGPGCVRD